MKNNYKIIFSDIDGTLIPFGQTQVSDYTFETIKALREMGIEFVVSTGRALNVVPKEIKKIMSNYAVVINGTAVYDIVNDKNIYELYMDKDDAIGIINELKDDKNVNYSAFINSHFSLEYKRSYPDQPEGTLMIEDTVDELINNNAKIQKFFVMLPKEMQKDYIERLSKKFPTLDFTSWADDNIEIVPKGGNKGVAIKALCKHLGLTLDQVIAMGDSDNDIQMLDTCAYGIVPGNGNDNAKKHATIVCGDCKDDGPARELRRIFGIKD